MKIKIQLLLLLTVFTANEVYSQNFNYAKALGGGSRAKIDAVAIDADYNVIIAGTFRDSIEIGSDKYVFNTNTNDNVFVAKFDTAANFIWSLGFQGTGTNGRLNLGALSVNSATGDIAITGEYRNQADFNGTVITEPYNKKALYIALINASGQLQWVYNAHGNTSSIEMDGRAIAFDGNDILAGCNLKGASQTVSGFSINNPGTKDVGFILRLDNTGAVTNGATIISAGTESGEINALKISEGNIYVLGTLKKNSGVIGNGTTLNVNNVTAAKDQFVLFSLDASLNAVWTAAPTADNKSRGQSLDIDAAGNIYIACEFEGNITLDGTNDFQSYPNKSSFIAAYSPVGNLQWSSAPQSSVSNAELRIRGIAADVNKLYIAGEFLQDYTIGSSTINAAVVNGIVGVYDLNGTEISAAHFSSADQCKLNAIASKNDVFITGGEMRADVTIPGIASALPLIGVTGNLNALFATSFPPVSSPTLPVLTTLSASNITATTADAGGDITDDGGATVTARGVCYSTNPNPTLADNFTTDGTGTGTFVSSITGLTPNVTYYLRAYATNSEGTAYGNEISFTTDNVTSVNSIDNSFGIKIYPNPSKDNIFITIQDIDEYIVSIIDITGKEVISVNATHSIVIDAKQLNNGIYFCKVKSRTGNFSSTKKIIVSH